MKGRPKTAVTESNMDKVETLLRTKKYTYMQMAELLGVGERSIQSIVDILRENGRIDSPKRTQVATRSNLKKVEKLFNSRKYTHKQMAEKLGVSRGSIEKMIGVLRGTGRIGQQKRIYEIAVTDTNTNKVEEMYKTGRYTHEEMAEKLGVSASSIARMIRIMKNKGRIDQERHKIHTTEMKNTNQQPNRNLPLVRKKT